MVVFSHFLFFICTLFYVGTELNVVLDVVLSCTAQLITYLPLESELIGAAAQTLVALSASQNGTRVAYIVNHASVGSIAQYVTSVSTSGGQSGGQSSGQSSCGCRLNASGFVAMYESLAMIFVRAGHEAYFTHVSYLYLVVVRYSCYVF